MPPDFTSFGVGRGVKGVDKSVCAIRFDVHLDATI